MLQMTIKETLYHRKQFYETLKNHGIAATIESISDNHEDAYDFYGDVQTTGRAFDGTINTYITYEEVPSIKTLRSLGWYIETEDFPVIGYLPVLYHDKYGEPSAYRPAVDDKVTVTVNVVDRERSTRTFLLKDFKGKGFPNTIYYIVKMVPYRKDFQ